MANTNCISPLKITLKRGREKAFVDLGIVGRSSSFRAAASSDGDLRKTTALNVNFSGLGQKDEVSCSFEQKAL